MYQCFDKLIWRAIGPKSFLFGTAQFSVWVRGAVNYDYIITNSINSLLIGSRCIPICAHTNHVEPIWPVLQNLSKLWHVDILVIPSGLKLMAIWLLQKQTYLYIRTIMAKNYVPCDWCCASRRGFLFISSWK